MKRITLCWIALFLLKNISYSQVKSNHLAEWLDNKYSMFIHFGLYSHLGGVWQGEQITHGYSEQIQAHAGIYSDVYGKTAEHFMPEKWSGDSIALLAKQAGMRSIVITSKHHDGFCMFKTQTTDYNIVDATPFKRDVVKELSEACKRHGLHFGLYFSLIDWHFPQAYPISSHNADFITPQHHEYNKRQLQELLTNYGAISELWFDMGSLTHRQSEELRNLVKRLQPQCLISGRLGNDQGDFGVMGDNEYPNYTIATPWQVPASMYDETWGYRSWQKHIPLEQKSVEKRLSLVRTVAKGGNFLLNIGPKGDGSVVEFEKNVLLKIGQWLKTNSEAIYQTKPLNLSETPDYCEITTRDNKIYIHLIDFPSNNKVVLKDILSKIKKAYPLDAPNDALTLYQNDNLLNVNIPVNFIKKDDIRVIVLETEGGIVVKPAKGFEIKSGLKLTPLNAKHHYSFSGVDYYTSYRSTIKYTWNIQNSGKNKPNAHILYSENEKNKPFILTINHKKIPINLTEGQPIPLSKNLVKWGEIAICHDSGAGLENMQGQPNALDLTQKWGKNDWIKMQDWQNDKQYEQKADFAQGWFWFQEITAARESQVLVKLPVNDGLVVYLNGQELTVINNPMKKSDLYHTILLPLINGQNKLLIKFFNRFGKQLKMGVFTNIPQVLYKKAMPELNLEQGKTNEIGLQLPPQYRIHQNVNAPNFSIEFK